MLCILLSASLSGCFDPHRVAVAKSTLESSDLTWNVTHFPQKGGSFGAKSIETLYSHEPTTSDPPFGGLLQVFSFRGGERQSTSELLRFTREVIDEAIEREGIRVDSREDREGSRTLRNGVKTKWFNHEGAIRDASGNLFDEDDITVRIHAEVGVDGKSSTSFVAIAFVQVARETDVLPGLGGRETDQRTWFELVADPKGTVRGATYSNPDRGFIYNLRTHA